MAGRRFVGSVRQVGGSGSCCFFRGLVLFRQFGSLQGVMCGGVREIGQWGRTNFQFFFLRQSLQRILIFFFFIVYIGSLEFRVLFFFGIFFAFFYILELGKGRSRQYYYAGSEVFCDGDSFGCCFLQYVFLLGRFFLFFFCEIGKTVFKFQNFFQVIQVGVVKLGFEFSSFDFKVFEFNFFGLRCFIIINVLLCLWFLGILYRGIFLMSIRVFYQEV